MNKTPSALDMEESNAYLAAIVESSDDAIISKNLDGIITSWNTAAERIFGYNAEEAVGKNISLIIPQDRQSEEISILTQIKAGKRVHHFETVRAAKDGRFVHLSITVSPIRNHKGAVIGASKVARDIGIQKALQQQLAETAKKMEAILDTVVDGVIVINEQAIIQSFNLTAEKIFGYTEAEVTGQNVKVLMPEPYHSEHDGYVHNYLHTGKAKIIGIGREVSGKRKNGEIFPMELGVGAFEFNKKRMFVGILRDISERKEMELTREQLRHTQKMEALGQLTGGIAHDFNNLLAIILGNLDFLKERTQEQDPLRGFIMPSIRAAEYGAELTQRLLAFGRKQALAPKNINLNELIVQTTNMARRTLGERLTITTAFEPNLWTTCIDPGQMENVLVNLALNARDAMPDGGKLTYETQNVILDEVYASQNPEVAPGEYVRIAVSDSGQGMTEDVLQKAFDPFFTTKETGKGTGMGLSMVYGFVKQSCGHIKLYSELGYGTTVNIYLPRVDTPSVALNVETQSRATAYEATKQKILVVEDNPFVLEVTSTMVKELGYIVLSATEGKGALEILENNQDIALLLTDVMLPGELNGPALAKKAVALRPGLKVLFNSGYAEHAIKQSGILENGVHLISKPFRKQQLAEKIKEVLQFSK